MNNYCIKSGYTARTDYIHYDDQEETDNWQLEVYLHALGLMKKHGLTSVADIGCGSGYKLVTYLGEYRTVGLELGVNLEFLKNEYPEREWLESNFDINHQLSVDVLICSDVIEHIVNPNDLINYINNIEFKYLVLSTPERELVYEKNSPYLDGPPANEAHQREWNFKEFADYISKNFRVLDHRVTNLEQSTQTMICEKFK